MVAMTLIVHATLVSEGMSAPSITRSVRQLRGTLVLRQSRIPVHCVETGHRMLFQEPKNNGV